MTQRGLFVLDNLSATVGSTTTEVLAADPTEKREYCSFANNSDETIWLGFGKPAVIGKGVPLRSFTGSYEMYGENRFTGAVNAICASGGKNLAITEGK